LPLRQADAWRQKIRRVGQVNMTERDPVELNVEEWADYWASLKVAVLVSVTGILRCRAWRRRDVPSRASAAADVP